MIGFFMIIALILAILLLVYMYKQAKKVLDSLQDGQTVYYFDKEVGYISTRVIVHENKKYYVVPYESKVMKITVDDILRNNIILERE